MILRRLFLIQILSTFISLGLAIKWLAIHQISPPWTDSNQCPVNKTERKQYGLVTYQSRLCKRAPELMPVMIRAANQAIDVCQKSFVDSRWNCSSILFTPNFKADLLKGTREQAFVHALSAASIVHTVAKACVAGELPFCPCGYAETTTTPGTIASPDTYKWKGCSDNIAYGKRISREWADAIWMRKMSNQRTRKFVLEFDAEHLNEEQSPRKLGFKAQMNQNNNDVGRRAVQKSQYRKCKCHGVSSSCDVKTCWNTLPSLDVIAQDLKDRYMAAYQIGQPYDATGSKSDGRSTRIPLKDKNEPELVFLRNSPNYCEENLELGSFGTTNRECTHNATDLTNDEPSNCRNLCCERGFNTKQFVVEESCFCKYVHCCFIKCRKCITNVERFYCR